MEAAMWATWSRLCVRGLLARGMSRSMAQSSIWMSMFGPATVAVVFFRKPDYRHPEYNCKAM